MPCDFCHGRPTKLFPARDFTVAVETKNALSVSAWSACDPCAALVEADDYGALIERVMQLVPSIPVEDRNNPDLIRLLKDTYAKFRAARTGPPQRIE